VELLVLMFLPHVGLHHANGGDVFLYAGVEVVVLLENLAEVFHGPRHDEEEEQDLLYQADDNSMALHIHSLDVFFKLYLPSLTDLQRALLKKALVELYKAFKIDWDTDVASLPPEAFPLFSDFHVYLQELAKDDKRYEEIAALFSSLG